MGSSKVYEVRNIKNLKDMLNQSADLFGNKNAFWLKDSQDRYTGITYKEFKKDVDALGTALTELNLKDAKIAVIGENRYEWCVTYLAVVNGVGTIVPLDKELPLEEVENLLNRSKASAIVFSGKHAAQMKRIAANVPSLKYFINMDSVNTESEILSFRELIKDGINLISSGNNTYLNTDINENIMNIILFTSGTTDLAKGVMLSHKNICSDIMAVCKSLYIDSNDSVLSILPLHHTYECTAGFLVMIYSGCTISFTEGLKHIGKNLKEVSPTILISVPLILEGMYKKIWNQASKKPGLKRKLKGALAVSNFLYNTFKVDMRRKLFSQIHDNIGGKIRLIISGAAAINPNVSKGFRAMGFEIRQGYGLTECSPIVTVSREDDFKDDSVGPALPGVEVKIDNPNSEGIGEIIVKGDNIMLGYYENQLASEKVLRGGWLYTGDLGQMDEHGQIYITGRMKNVIVTKNGKNIFPEEVEAYLNKSPFILESLVSGEDNDSGETIVNAQIVPDLEAIKEQLQMEEISEKEILNLISAEVKRVNKVMPLYKRIRNFKVRQEEFAKTTTRKIKRYVEKTG